MEQQSQTGTTAPAIRTLPEAAKPYMFKPGQSGNPSGRPKKILTEKLIERLTKQRLTEVVEAQIDAAIKGRTDAFIAIRETVEGKMQAEQSNTTAVAVEIQISYL